MRSDDAFGRLCVRHDARAAHRLELAIERVDGRRVCEVGHVGVDVW